MKVRLTRRADCELDRIQDYYESRTGSSERIVAQLDEAFEHLAKWPNSGHHRTELLSERYRFWRVGSYFMVYFVDSPWLTVVTILHAARDLAKDLEFLQ